MTVLTETMEECCAVCGFGVPVDQQVECRRFPPSSFPVTRINPISKQPESSVMAFPVMVPATHWCGEFTPREEFTAKRIEYLDRELQRNAKGGKSIDG